MHSTDLHIDVSDAVGLGEALSVAATVHTPDEAAIRAIVVAYPGSGYNRSYYDLRIKGNPSFSQAKHHCERGIAVVACDHLCVGGSSMPTDALAVTLEHIAAANARAASVTLAQLPDVPAVGVGQSMGGCLLTVEQAVHGSFDAVAFLGWSAIHTTFPDPSGSGRVKVNGLARGTDLHTAQDLPYWFTADQLRYCYHFDDVDPAIVAPDVAAAAHRNSAFEAGGSTWTGDVPSWRSATGPACSKCMVTAGVVAPEAAAITVPVLSLCGERDVLADPSTEPSAYRSSPDASVVVVPAMAHMHNFASTRRLFWDVLVSWIDVITVRTVADA